MDFFKENIAIISIVVSFASVLLSAYISYRFAMKKHIKEEAMRDTKELYLDILKIVRDSAFSQCHDDPSNQPKADWQLAKQRILIHGHEEIVKVVVEIEKKGFDLSNEDVQDLYINLVDEMRKTINVNSTVSKDDIRILLFE